MRLKNGAAISLINDVYRKAFENTDSFEDIGSPLAYLLGGLSTLAIHGSDDERGTVFEAVGDHDQRFIEQMRQWFPREHRIWRHIKTDEEP